jgi:UDP-N-acetylmuramoyl-tripeptide--D-alanyl-D-alanine ligase
MTQKLLWSWSLVFKLTISEITSVTSGIAVNADSDMTVSGFFVDSRQCLPGGVFVAIKGEQVDGHDFLVDVQAQGASLGLVESSFRGNIPLDFPHIIVENSVVALGRIAHWVRVTKLKATVLAVTGSSGKTTTKDLIAGILSESGSTKWAQGSFNTEVGLPLTILGANPMTKYLVLEMGMRGVGHIDSLVQIAVPDIGIITNIGSAHLGLLGSRENIAAAKGELTRGLGKHAHAVLNADDQFAPILARETVAQVVTFGESESANFRATNIEMDTHARASYTLHTSEGQHQVVLKIPGEHQVSNSLAAITAVVSAGISVPDAVDRINRVEKISKWRMEVTQTASGVTIINDSYNANPESMRAALKTLANMAEGRRSVAVLGEMKELGSFSLEEHDSLGRLAVRLDISQLICVGPEMKVTHLGASQEGSWGEESLWVPDIDSAITLLTDFIQSGDVVLIKASRSVGLERVAQVLISGDLDGGTP